jgi:hypothetical protein
LFSAKVRWADFCLRFNVVELACHVAPAEKLAEENERLKSEIEVAEG